MGDRPFRERTTAHIIAAVDFFCQYYELMRTFVANGDITSSVDRGTFVRSKDVLSPETYKLLGDGRRSNSHAYGPEAGDYHIRQLIAELDNERFGTAYSRTHVAVVPGAWAGVELVLEELFKLTRGTLHDGHLVIVGPTHYQMFHRAINFLGIDVRAYDFVDAGAPHVPTSWDDFEPIFATRPTAIFLTNPNNPDGLYISPSLLREVVERATSERIYVVLDEIQDLFPSSPDVGLGYGPWIQTPYVIRIDSLSKKRGLAEYRVGWVLADPPLLGTRTTGLIGRTSGLLGNAPRAANTALAHILAAMRTDYHAAGTLAGLYDDLARKEGYVSERLRSLTAARLFPRDASINTTVQFMLGLRDLDMSERLMRRGTLVMPCTGYGYDSSDCVMRITFAERDDKLTHAMDALVAEVSELSS
jgi:aspartate/methionine/tyrosine aminotransferase